MGNVTNPSRDGGDVLSLLLINIDIVMNDVVISQNDDVWLYFLRYALGSWARKG